MLTPEEITERLDDYDAGDSAAGWSLVEAFLPTIRKCAWRTVRRWEERGHRVDHDDLCHEACLEMFRKLPDYKPHYSYFPVWARAVAKSCVGNEAVKIVRRLRRECGPRFSENLHSSRGSQSPASAACDRELVSATIAPLREPLRSVARMSFLEGYNDSEIADALGTSTTEARRRRTVAGRKIAESMAVMGCAGGVVWVSDFKMAPRVKQYRVKHTPGVGSKPIRDDLGNGYTSLSAASVITDIPLSTLGAAVRTGRVAGGRTWKYEEAHHAA